MNVSSNTDSTESVRYLDPESLLHVHCTMITYFCVFWIAKFMECKEIAKFKIATVMEAVLKKVEY